MAKRTDSYRVEAGGRVVTADRIPVETRDHGWGPVKQQKSLFEVRVDDELRGRLLLATGFGSDWQAWSFGRVDIASWDSGNPQHLNRTHSVNRDGPLDVLAKFAAWAKAGKAPTRPELSAFLRDKAEEERRRKEDDERSAARARAEHKAEKAAAKAERSDRLQALKSIRERLSTQMTNFEAANLESAIADLEAQIATAEAHEIAFGA